MCQKLSDTLAETWHLTKTGIVDQQFSQNAYEKTFWKSLFAFLHYTKSKTQRILGHLENLIKKCQAEWICALQQAITNE